MDRNETIEAIRTALKNRSGKTWSVTGGRGTAWGWITISVPPSRLGCAGDHVWDSSGVTCRDCQVNYLETRGITCEAHTCTDKCYRNYITPTERAELATLLGVPTVHCQGVSIPASSDNRAEWVARAAGLTPIRCGKQYWD